MCKIESLEQKTPLSWVLNLANLIKAKQDEITRRKINALERKAYDYYLTIYIADIVINKKIDFHPELYLSGRIDCPFARKQAIFEVKRIVKQGKERINQCFSILLENIKEERHNQKNKRGFIHG